MAVRNELDFLPEALQPFARALAIHDGLPARFKPNDETPLCDILPGGWPTVADLRELVKWARDIPPESLANDKKLS